MESIICFFCQRDIYDHTKAESIECSLKICNGNVAVDARGIDGQLTRNQPAATQEFSK